MQSSITSFFKKPATSHGAVKKPATKRTKALSAKATEQLKLDAQTQSIAPSVRAKIEGNRAAARIKRLHSMNIDLSSQDGLVACLEPSWRAALKTTMSEQYWTQLVNFVCSERKSQTIYPPPDQVFSAFNHSTFPRTRVIIIGQDPYHGPGQAHGMSFSVPSGIHPPPSLINIFQELNNDIEGFVKPKSGHLEHWANQGVLLLNSVLTVRRGSPGSHQNRGWERFTDAVVHAVNHRKGPGVVFMLWGGYAKKKGAGINRSRHCVLTSVHPSPLSANRGGWFGNKHFSKANEFLVKTGQDPIEWKFDQK